MKYLRLVPNIHHKQPIVKASFSFDKEVMGLAKQQKGLSLGHIQILLGHNSSKTTKRYTQVSIKEIGTFINPLKFFFNKREMKQYKRKVDIH